MPNALYEFDRAEGAEELLLCGIDEAGRGPLCGPVTVAAVILDKTRPIEGLNDSKKLSEKKRDILFEEILQKACCFAVVHITPEQIDELNIHHATLLGMKQAAEQLAEKPEKILVDGIFAPEIDIPCTTVVKGDGKSASIAAASILAKVSRDRLMCRLAEEYPQYRLEQHKGYPTKLHYELLEQYGVAPIYRRSFLTKRGLV